MRSLTFQEKALEKVPGILAWTTFILAPVMSYTHPSWVAIYIIVFDLYWLMKGANVAIHLLHSHSLLKVHKKINWLDWAKRQKNRPEFVKYLLDLDSREKDPKLRTLYAEQLIRLSKVPRERDADWDKLYHLIIFPAYKEDLTLLEASIDSYLASDYPNDKLIFVLGAEERAGEHAEMICKAIAEKYKDKFLFLLTTIHPDGIVGEVRGKGGNMNFAVEAALKELDKRQINYDDVIVSTFDADTIIEPNYFSYLTYDFLTEEKPHQRSYQPMPVYNNNIWETPAIARVVAVSSSFWQLVEASRPDRLVTFASHAMSLKSLVAVGLFRADSIDEDSFIFWQCFVYYNGDYKTKPMFTTVSMDAVMGQSYFDTLVAQYKQKRRWAYGVSQISFIIPNFLKNKKIPLWKKLVYGERFIEGHYFWATASIMITMLGWMPLILGGDRFGGTVLGNNLPFLTRIIMTAATFFLVCSVYVNLVLLPPRPKQYGKRNHAYMVLQWFLTPIVSTIFGSLPAIDAQTRLLLGKYMEFWVTPKIRGNQVINSTPTVLEKETVKVK